ncbi:MAG: hypothetical protein ACFFAJ_08230 [Candidatus Hodarchaeota archaeon]
MKEKNANKVVLYVKSINVNTRSFADQQGGGRSSITHDRGTGFMSYKNSAVNLEGVGDRVGHFYSEEDWKALNIARIVQEKAGIEIKLVDLRASMWNRVKLTLKGMGKTPQFMINGERLSKIRSVKQLLDHLEEA